MRFREVDLVSMDAAGAPVGGLLQVRTQPHVSLTEEQVGFITGKHRFNLKGVICLGGIVHSGWAGNLTVELMPQRKPLSVKAGEKVAHLVVLTEGPLPTHPGEYRVG